MTNSGLTQLFPSTVNWNGEVTRSGNLPGSTQPFRTPTCKFFWRFFTERSEMEETSRKPLPFPAGLRGSKPGTQRRCLGAHNRTLRFQSMNLRQDPGERSRGNLCPSQTPRNWPFLSGFWPRARKSLPGGVPRTIQVPELLGGCNKPCPWTLAVQPWNSPSAKAREQGHPSSESEPPPFPPRRLAKRPRARPAGVLGVRLRGQTSGC